jgi:hypothetical protein
MNQYLILREFRKNRLNIIIDSPTPFITPHIVISPTLDTWEQTEIAWRNRIPIPQYLSHLYIPQFAIGPCALPPTEKAYSIVEVDDAVIDIDDGAPAPVFNRAKFNRSVSAVSHFCACSGKPNSSPVDTTGV